jgi:hypothetical protein
MIYDIYLGQGDSDYIEITLSDANGVINLSSASNITLVINDVSETVIYEMTCTGNSAGVIGLNFTDTQTSIAGDFFGQFLVTIGGKQTTWPENDFIKIHITEGLARVEA